MSTFTQQPLYYILFSFSICIPIVYIYIYVYTQQNSQKAQRVDTVNSINYLYPPSGGYSSTIEQFCPTPIQTKSGCTTQNGPRQNVINKQYHSSYTHLHNIPWALYSSLVKQIEGNVLHV